MVHLLFSNSGAVCCLHNGDPTSSEPIICLSEKSLAKCTLVLQRRKENHLKYSDVTPPIGVISKEGYHISCYRKFIALPKKHRIEENIPEAKQRTERAKRYLNTTSPNTGIFKPVCLFCNQSRKRTAGKTIDLLKVTTKDFENKVKQYAEWKNDQEMLVKITDVDFVAKEIRYHGMCRVKYQKEAEYVSGQKKNQRGHWHLEREIYADAFVALANQVEEEIIRGKQVYRVNDLLIMYQSLIREGRI